MKVKVRMNVKLKMKSCNRPPGKLQLSLVLRFSFKKFLKNSRRVSCLNYYKELYRNYLKKMYFKRNLVKNSKKILKFIKITVFIFRNNIGNHVFAITLNTIYEIFHFLICIFFTLKMFNFELLSFGTIYFFNIWYFGKLNFF